MNDSGVMEGLRLSVLDQSPVAAGTVPGQALQNSIELARLVDGLGYSRYWMLDDFPEQVSELLAFLSHGEGHSFPAGHPFAGIRVAPEMPGGPDVWMLGSSMWSAAAAVEFGLPYSFAHFFSPVHTRAAIETYRRGFTPSGYRGEGEGRVAVGVMCAGAEEEGGGLCSCVRVLGGGVRGGGRRGGG